MSLLVVLMLAGAVVDGPCVAVDRAVADDATVASDSRLREGAALAEAAGDFAQAESLLQRLRDRTRNPGVRAEAQDALSMIPGEGSRSPCSTQSRKVALIIDDGVFLEPHEIAQLRRATSNELRQGQFEVAVDLKAPAACTDERCVRRTLFEGGAGAMVRLLPTRVGPLVTVAVDVVSFKGSANYTVELDADAARWSPVLPNAVAIDLNAMLPAPRVRSQRDDGIVDDSGIDTDPIIAGVSMSLIGALVGAAGVLAAASPDLLADVSKDEDLVRTVGIGTAVGGFAVAVGGLVAVALIVDSQNSLERRERSDR